MSFKKKLEEAIRARNEAERREREQAEQRQREWDRQQKVEADEKKRKADLIRRFHERHSSYFRSLFEEINSADRKKGKIKIEFCSYTFEWGNYKDGKARGGHRIKITISDSKIWIKGSVCDIQDPDWQSKVEAVLLKLVQNPSETSWYDSGDETGWKDGDGIGSINQVI